MHNDDRSDFYQDHLDRVSRSFAFCIARLDNPLREWVGLSYLLCRIVDTIEDAAWPVFTDQERAFTFFESFLERKPQASEIEAWTQLFPHEGLPESETELLKDAYPLFCDYHGLPPEIRESLRDPILSMSRGMRFFMTKKNREGLLRLRNLADVNRYCFFVAGVVGEILTRLVKRENAPGLIDAFRFGLFLQKVNLLKDQNGDETHGRFLVPSRSLVLRSLIEDARIAFDYVQSLPKAEVGYRLFCSWSLFLGLASLPWIERGYRGEGPGKIPREETYQILGFVDENIGDQAALADLFERLLRAIEIPSEAERVFEESAESLQELSSLYKGELSPAEVAELLS